MKGNNTLNFNEASMIEAMQFYFDKVLFAKDKAPKVFGIDLENRSDKNFVIKTQTEEE